MNGIVFHIEEDAYEILKSYMTEVKRHFAYTPDSDEIVTDIENRLAEMFSERLATDNKQVIVLLDVNEVTAQMGSVNEFEQEDEEPVNSGEGSFKAGKTLYRDMDDRIVGGVCAGVGHYFNIEPRWVRLILLILVFFGGTGIVAYLILWLIVPKAVTRTDKMVMKGEPLNIQNFKKNFDEEVEGLRHGIKRAHHEARPLIEKLGSLIVRILKLFIKIVGGFIIFAGVMSLLGLIISLIVFLGFGNSTEIGYYPYNIFNPEYKSIISVSAFIILIIPLVALVLFAIRVLFNKTVVTRTTSFAMLIIWLTGVGFGIYYGAKVGAEFKEEATFSQVTDLKPSPVYLLKLNAERYLTKEDSLRYHLDGDSFKGRIIINGDDEGSNLPDNVHLKIELSDVDKPVLMQVYSASGRNFENALETAEHTNYRFIQADSVLKFDRTVYLRKGELWRDQSVTLILKVPKNTRLMIDGKLNRYLNDYNLRDCQPENSSSDFISEWMMTDKGLKCKNDSLYEANTNDN